MLRARSEDGLCLFGGPNPHREAVPGPLGFRSAGGTVVADSSRRLQACVLRSPRLSTTTSPASRTSSTLFDGRPALTHRSTWGYASPTPLAGSCCSLRCRPSQERFRTRERQNGAPSIERVLHHEAWQEGAVQIPLNFTGAVAKDPVPGRDGGRENKPSNEQCYAREPGPGILACRGGPSLAIMLARGTSRTSCCARRHWRGGRVAGP